MWWICRLLRGGVDWNHLSNTHNLCSNRRLLRGGVDWNQSTELITVPAPVASFAEAWIEIQKSIKRYVMNISRLLRGGVDWNTEALISSPVLYVASFAEAWIEIQSLYLCIADRTSRLLRGGVDWNHLRICRMWEKKCRLLRGGVDWNFRHDLNTTDKFVASFAEAWIEILLFFVIATFLKVASFAEAWIEI